MEDLPGELYSFLECLKCLRDVKDACFGMKVHPSYEDFISKFKESFIKLSTECQEKFGVDLSVTWKIHIIINHVPQFLRLIPQHGLGVYAEQVLESSHKHLLPTLNRYKCLASLGREEWARRAIVDFSSRNM